MAVAHRTASSAEIRAVVGATVTQLTVTNRLLQGQLRAIRPVVCIPLTPNHCRLRREWCEARAHRRLQPALTVPVLTDQVLQAWNPTPQTNIRCLYGTMHARLHACIQNSGGYTGY
uniref:Transposase Tc1-like domain-containing protein n=2 Tax=Araneus ventricosus TaxID=182803 RepID=A0A4Y2WD75_ARAVE|nr:hypothetical protein AVEN_40430-1 [Araneus ventricosus]